jgi:hypothetical protein
MCPRREPQCGRGSGAGVRQWLGEGSVVKRADGRGIVIQSKDGLRQFRMDLEGHGPYAPHGHLEMRGSTTGKFKDAPGVPHHLYFQP